MNLRLLARSLLAALVLAIGPSAAAAEPRAAKPVAGPFGSRADLNVEYGKAGEVSLKLDLYRPPAKQRGPYPVVAYVHGGGWIGGSKAPCPCVNLITNGFAVASVEYRLSTVAPFPAQIEDCKAAIRWLRANAKKHELDPERIGAAGASAGGHLVALLGTSGDAKDLEGDAGNAGVSSRVCAVCDYFGPTDLLQWDGHGSVISATAADSLITTFLGGPISQRKDVAVRANPITYVTPDDPPFLILHGDKDNIVPIGQSRILDAALRKAGVPTRLHVVEGAGHGFNDATVNKMVLEFLEKNVRRAKKPKPSAEPPCPTPEPAMKDRN